MSAILQRQVSGTLMMLCRCCGHVEFASVPAGDTPLLLGLTTAMQDVSV